MSTLIESRPIESLPIDQPNGLTLGAHYRMEHTEQVIQQTGRHKSERRQIGRHEDVDKKIDATYLRHTGEDLDFTVQDQILLHSLLQDGIETQPTRHILRQNEREEYKKSHRIASFGYTALSKVLRFYK